jgi:hypothetical protein
VVIKKGKNLIKPHSYVSKPNPVELINPSCDLDIDHWIPDNK